MMPRVLACVVAYHPDNRRLQALVARLQPEVADVLVIDNGQSIDPTAAPWSDMPGVHWYSAPGNLGVGAALNLARQRALEGPYDFLLTFDQDSLPPAGYVTGLLDIWSHAGDAVCRWAALGPAIRDEVTGRTLPVRRVDPQLHLVLSADPWPARQTLEVDHAITSGCLYPVAALSAVGPFKGDWFVDMVDTEWCWRARHRGWSVMQTGALVLEHTIGKAGATVLGRQVLAHPPQRIYFQVRNTLWLLRSREVPRGWRRQLLVPLARKLLLQPLLPDRRWARLLAMVRGGVHGLWQRPGG
ncbi:glycosyltransferase family 2 protein [Acidovorax sp.]|jgi:rhamnosyltransferase|uniref:glycosyltransferase family 2 protein n=1 Tax=Acidovorax sp. TaxID=1872122 RepID=UPI00391F8D9C